MELRSPFEEYQIGQVLSLSVIPGKNETRLPTTPSHTFLLHGRGCTVVDALDKGYSDSPLFLKLYDRRFSDQLRKDEGIDSWTPEAEKKSIDAVRTGASEQFLHNLHTIPNYVDDTGSSWSDAQCEMYLADRVDELYNAETAVYDALGDIQGTQVPRLIACIHLPLASSYSTSIEPSIPSSLVGVKGILLQHIDGFPLSKVQDHAPRTAWQDIVDQAVAAVQAVGDRNVLNRDVRPGNFLVQHEKDGAYRVFMIDFGLARLRRANETDRAWAVAKLEEDEERAVGLVMKKILDREGFELRFEKSSRYMEYDVRDDEGELFKTL